MKDIGCVMVSEIYYVETTENEDVLCSLELVQDLAPQLQGRPAMWKWFIIAVHNALQGTLVCALSGTADVGALSTKSAKETLAFLEREFSEGETPVIPEERLASFRDLIERARNPDRMHNQPLTVPDCHNDLLRLNELRNDWIHFTPKSWSVRIADLPRICDVGLSAVEQLVSSNSSVLDRMGEKQQKAALRCLSDARASLKALSS